MKRINYIKILFAISVYILLITGCQNTPSKAKAESIQEISTEWLDEHGMQISKQGKFTETLYSSSGKALKLPCTINIIEEIPDQESKNIIATVTYDYSKITDASHWYWYAAFDRYTGQCFNIKNLDLGDYEAPLCASTIVMDGKSYYISGIGESDANFPIETVVIIITVPMAYDGLVFQIGYYSDADQQTEVLDDPEVDLITEKDSFKYNNFYFTLSDI